MILGGSRKVPQLQRYQVKSGPVYVGRRIKRWIVVLAVGTFEFKQPIVLNGIINLSLGDTQRAQCRCLRGSSSRNAGQSSQNESA